MAHSRFTAAVLLNSRCLVPLTATLRFVILLMPALCFPAYAQLPDGLTESAHAGDAGAQALLGWHLQQGEGIAADPQAARRWYLMSAKQGHANAQNNLAMMLFNGDGGERQPTQARHWFKQSAAQGDSSASFNLAQMYLRGEGGPLNYAEAARWLERASLANEIDAQVALGKMLMDGDGIDRDIVAGFAWLIRASQSGNAAANNVRREAELTVSPEQIVAAERLAMSVNPARTTD